MLEPAFDDGRFETSGDHERIRRKTSYTRLVEPDPSGTWADHYAEAAMYLRLSRVLPPTAKK